MSDPFDIVLAYVHFRLHEQYLNVAQALGTTRRIALVRIGVEAPAIRKTARTDALYFEDCLHRGAVSLPPKAHTRLLVIPVLYDLALLEAIHHQLRDRLSWERCVVVQCGPFTGVPNLPELIERFGKPLLLIPDTDRYGILVPGTRESADRLGCERREVGTPHGRYPAFPSFRTDYLVSYPSTVSVTDFRQLYGILRGIQEALETLPPEAVVYTKRHNVRDEGNYLSDLGPFRWFPLPRPIGRFLLKAFDRIAQWRIGSKTMLDRLPLALLWKVFYLQNSLIFSRTQDLSKEYPGFGIEHFLSGVKKGLIAGMGSPVWEALYQRVPIYLIKTQPYEQMHVNYQRLYDSLEFRRWEKRFMSEDVFGLIAESARRGDLIKTLEHLLTTNREASHANYN